MARPRPRSLRPALPALSNGSRRRRSCGHGGERCAEPADLPQPPRFLLRPQHRRGWGTGPRRTVQRGPGGGGGGGDKRASCMFQYLSSCVVGASLESVEGEEEESENRSEAEVSRRPKEGLYQIVGTLSKPESIKPCFAEETYAVSHNLISGHC